MKQLVLDEMLKTTLLDYLSTRPIREALPLYQMLQSLPELPQSLAPPQPVSRPPLLLTRGFDRQRICG